MKLSVNVEIFRDALSKMLSVVDRKNPRGILTYVLLTAEKNQIFLESTDLEISSKVSINADVLKSGTICVEPRNLFNLIKEMPHLPLYLNTEGNSNLLRLNCDQVNASLLICSPEEFPKLSFTGSGDEFELKGKEALYFINKIFHAIGYDESRVFLNGIFLQQKGKKLRAVATNGYTFALIESDKSLSTNEILNKGVIIPKKGVLELKRLAEQDESHSLHISINESFMYIRSGDRHQLAIRLIAKEYPPYQSVIPSKTSYSMTVSREHLMNAIKRVKVLANETSNAVKLSINEKKLTISANHPLLGEATEKIDADYVGKHIDIGFNAHYMIDSLSVLEDEKVTLEFNNELSPVIVKSQKLKEFLGIVMPLKL